MQFWPGKMKMWFANPNTESPMGKMEQKYIKDENTGEKILQYFTTTQRTDGTYELIETDEDTGDPVMV